MSASRVTRTLAACLAASVLAACGDDAESGSKARDGRPGHAAEKRAGHQDQKQAAKRDRSRNNGGSKPRVGAAAGTASNPAGGGGTGGTNEGRGPQPQDDQPAESCMSDRAGDLESAGSAPAYVDLTRGCLRERGGVVTAVATVAGDLPGSTGGQNTNASIGFELTLPSGPHIFVYADATANGWTAHLSRGGRQRELTDALALRGRELSIEFDAAELGGTKQLQWILTSSWLESTLLTTSYAFDGAPEAGSARFDR